MKEYLQARLANINQQLQQSLATYNAILGAKAECEFMLAELAKKELEAQPEVVSEPDAA